MTTKTLLVLTCTLVTAVACRPEDQETGTLDVDEAQETREQLPPELLARLDSGNAAYRRDDYQASLEHYTAATEMEEDVAAAWFGVYMAQKALGNDAAADSALEQAQGLAPGATLMHPGGGEETAPPDDGTSGATE